MPGYVTHYIFGRDMYEKLNDPVLKNNLYKNDLQVDFLKLKSGNSLAQFFAIFMVSEDFYKYRNIPPISEKEYF